MNYYNLLKIEYNFIPQNIIKEILENKSETFSQATVGYEDHSYKVKSEYRKTKWLNLPNYILNNLKNTIYSIHETHLKNFYNSELCDIEGPQFLRYDVGDHYITHNDSESFVNNRLKRVSNRDISILMYLNDKYEGGSIDFVNLGLTIKPKTGMMVVFPSYIEFNHKVNAITAGTRYNLVSWISTKKRIYKRPYDEDSSL